MSSKVNKEAKTLIAREVTTVNTLTKNEENPYEDVNKPASYQSNIEAYFKSNSPSKVDISYETEEEYQARMQWWKDAKYGMFIH